MSIAGSIRYEAWILSSDDGRPYLFLDPHTLKERQDSETARFCLLLCDRCSASVHDVIAAPFGDPMYLVTLNHIG